MIFFLVFALICAATSTFGVKVQLKDCPEGAGPKEVLFQVTSANAIGCENEPCIYYRGQVYDVEINSVANYTMTESDRLEIVVVALTPMGPVPMIKDDMCKRFKELKCNEIKPGYTTSLKISELIMEVYPIFEGDVRFVVKKNGESIYCTQVTVKIQQKPPSMEMAMNRAKTQAEVNDKMQNKMKNSMASGGFGFPG